MPSHYEGFGYAAAQALCAGTPCIVSDRGALPEVVGSDAPVVPVENASQWAHALKRAMRGDDDARATSVRAAAIDRLLVAGQRARMRDLYAGVVGTS